MRSVAREGLKVADEVWIAAALLHREHPDQDDFAVERIVERARREHLTDQLRPGVYVHAVQHCVANRRANPGRYRMLVETAPNRRRLFREGDPVDASRRGGKMLPLRDQIPATHRHLLDWYEAEYARRAVSSRGPDPLLALRGSGQKLWRDETADAYVDRLREHWR